MVPFGVQPRSNEPENSRVFNLWNEASKFRGARNTYIHKTRAETRGRDFIHYRCKKCAGSIRSLLESNLGEKHFDRSERSPCRNTISINIVSIIHRASRANIFLSFFFQSKFYERNFSAIDHR